MPPIEQPDTDQSTKNNVDFRETLPLIWALSACQRSVSSFSAPSPLAYSVVGRESADLPTFAWYPGSFGKPNKLNKFPSQPKKLFLGGEGIVPQTCKATL